MRAAIYARVSTERQERQQTIDSQLDLLRAWARSADHVLSEDHVFRDEGHSGARLDRPGLDALRDFTAAIRSSNATRLSTRLRLEASAVRLNSARTFSRPRIRKAP